jgi:hypothetical protein
MPSRTVRRIAYVAYVAHIAHAAKIATLLASLLASLLAVPGALSAADFPPITEEEKALKAVSGAPNAPAVVLFHNGEFQMLDLASHEVSSRLTVQNRVKILTAEGKDQGEIELEHSDDVRLSGFSGRTVLPDGTVVPVPADAKFVRRLSKNRKLYVTAVAFPAVQVGAILDYRYDLHFDSIFYLEPWYFASRLPVLHSEITYLIPSSLGIQTWGRDPYSVGVKSERSGTVRGNKLRTWADRVPPVPKEPWGFPFEDLAAQVTVIPTAVSFGGSPQRLLETWATTSELLLEFYDQALGSHGDAKRKARELTAAAKGQRQQAEVLYRFVRDQVPNDDSTSGVVLPPQGSVDTVLKKGGNSVRKALLLVSMLDTVKIKARPVWAAGHDSGTVDLRLANPAWFDRVLVAAEIDGARVFLDPAEPNLGFGQLPSELEGTNALIPDRKKPEALVLPETPAERNARRAEVKLAVDDKGALAGSGTLRLSGHPAAARIGWKDDAAKTAAAWKEWLEKSYKEFAISDVQVTEAPEEPKVEVRWAMAERPEEVLGDQATLLPSRPLGPTAQPFKVSIAKRGAPILFDYADRDEVELALAWPAGWSLGTLPKTVREESDAGVFTSEVEVKEAERTLTYRRRMDVKARLFLKSDHCERLRTLFDRAEKSDATGLVLVRRK